MRTQNDGQGCVACGCGFLLVLFNIIAGSWSVDYLLSFITTKDLPFLADAVIGLFAAELSVPTAIVVYLLKSYGVM